MVVYGHYILEVAQQLMFCRRRRLSHLFLCGGDPFPLVKVKVSQSRAVSLKEHARRTSTGFYV